MLQRCLLLIPFLLGGDGVPDGERVPEETAAVILARIPAEDLARFLSNAGGALTPSDLPGLPDLATLHPNRSRLRRWFEARGVTRSRAMLAAFAKGLLRRATGVPPDWEGIAREAAGEELREFGPPVAVPRVWGWVPPDREGLLGGPFRTVFLTVTEEGAIWLDGREVSLDDLPDRLFPHAELFRDDGDPRKPGSLVPVLRVDSGAPWDRVRAAFAALDHPALRFGRIGFVFEHDDTDDLGGERLAPPSRAPAAPGQDVVSLALRKSDMWLIDPSGLTAYLARRPGTPPRVALSVDPSLGFGDVGPVLVAICEAGVAGVTFADLPAWLQAPPDPDTPVWVDERPLFDPRDPAEAVQLALSLTPPADLVERIEVLGGMLCPYEIPGVPFNHVRPGRPGAFALWEWFASRGVDDAREAFRVLCAGIEVAARGGEPDFERLVVEALLRQGPPVDLPWVPGTEELWYDDYGRKLRGRVDARGRLFIRGEMVAPAELSRRFAMSGGGVLDLLADRRLPFRGLGPILGAVRPLGEGVDRVALHYWLDDTTIDRRVVFSILLVEIDRILGWRGPSLRLHLAEGPDAAPRPGEIATALDARRGDRTDVLFVVDDGVSLQRVMEAAAGCVEAGIREFVLHLPGDFEPWVEDPPASLCLDGVPVRATGK